MLILIIYWQEHRELDSCEDITHPSQWDLQVASNQNLTQRAQSTSCLDLHTSSDRENLRNLLPSYRPAPDYETAIQQKYRNSSSALIAPEPLRNIVYSSQPEIHQTDGAYAPHLRYPDLTHNTFEQKNQLYGQGFMESAAPFVYNSDGRQVNFDNVGVVHVYKQPPPYPANRIGSNSTPDLAGISQQTKLPNLFVNSLISGSSPDLVSSDNRFVKRYSEAYQNAVHRSHSYLPQQHSTYENISSVFNNNLLARPVIVDDPTVTKHIKKVCDEHGNILYCLPANVKQIIQTKLPSKGFVVMHNPPATQVTDSPEPIYENLPRTWQMDSEARSRAQSVHSAPDISQVVNHSLVNALQNKIGFTDKENVYANIGQDAQLGNSVHHPDNFTTVRASNDAINIDGNGNAASSFNVADDSTTSLNSTASKTKKKRWGLLKGKSSRSEDKMKSATLKTDKKKEEKGQGGSRHRWSTGQPKFNPLPPSISKETMVSFFKF